MVYDHYALGCQHYDWVWPGVYERTIEDYPYGYSVECKAVAEGCHPVSQYPYYIFWWKKTENQNVG